MMSKVRRKQTFREQYSEEFDFIKKSNKENSFAFCCVCCCDINIAHGGKSDILSHAKTAKHVTAFNTARKSSKITDFVATASDYQTIRAELLFTGFLMEHNIPLAAADHVSKLLSEMFPNSPEVKKYSCGRTKTGHLVKEIAACSIQRIENYIKNHPFTIATDGSHDSADNQMYPLVVSFFDVEVNQVKCTLFKLPILEADCTGKNIADLIINEFSSHNIPWRNCLSLSSDNARVMTGYKNGVIAHLQEKHSNMIVFGCLCHLVNLAAEKAAKTLPVSFDDILVDIYYYFHRSSKRKLAFKKFQNLCDEDQGKRILKHCATRWLSLGKCISRQLEQWRSLVLYFKEECNNMEKFTLSANLAHFTIPKINKAQVTPVSSIGIQLECASGENTSSSSRIVEVPKKSKLINLSKNKNEKKRTKAFKSLQPSKKHKSGEETKKNVSMDKTLTREERIFLYLSSNLNHALAFFIKNVITFFENFNVKFQCEKPLVHKLKSELTLFFTEILSRFVKITVINNSHCVFNVQYNGAENQKEDKDLVIGSETSDFIKELSPDEVKNFYAYVRKYYCAACSYILKTFPHKSELLEHAEVADVSKREKMMFSSVRFFVDKYPVLLLQKNNETTFNALDALEGEYLKFQTDKLSDEVLTLERADEQWAYLSRVKGPTGQLQFERLSKVMLGILLFPHSNAACERIFSVVRKNKTEFRSSMSPSTLQALLIGKSQISDVCYRQTYDEKFLKRAKSATTVALNKE